MTILRTLPEFRRICKDAARAAAEYAMLAEGDRVIVGISGGEDSFVLMHVLTELQRRAPFHFDLIAAHVNMGFGTFDEATLQDLCSQYGWQLESVRLDGYALLKEKNAEDRPCALCSRLRRGQLHALADKLDCNKIALGQHQDDLCVSFLMSLFHGGGLKTMGPNVAADSASKRLIRPLCTTPKQRIHALAEALDFHPLKSCPYEQQLKDDGDRFYLENLLKQLDGRFPDVTSAMLHSMADARLAHLLDKRYIPQDDDPDTGKL